MRAMFTSFAEFDISVKDFMGHITEKVPNMDQNIYFSHFFIAYRRFEQLFSSTAGRCAIVDTEQFQNTTKFIYYQSHQLL